MMATVANQTQSTRYARIPVWLRELHFVTDFFSWLFALCSRLAEPFMLLCTLYIVAEAGVPTISLPALHNLAIGIMITAPEIILPGAFVVASHARSQGEHHASLLLVVCWLFVTLTLITLVSLFVWHFAGMSLAWLMCARCAVAVGYSILMRIMNHGLQVNQVQVVHQQEIEQRITALVEQFNTRLQVVQSEVVQQVQMLVQSQVSEQVQASQAIVLEQVTAQVQANQSTIINQVQASQSTMMEGVSAQIVTAMQEMKRDLRSVIAEATASSSDSSVSSSPKVARQLRSVPTPVQSEPGNEPASVRVPRFIQEQVNQGHKPSLSEIEEACQCSRNTAIRYRREQLGDDEGVA